MGGKQKNDETSELVLTARQTGFHRTWRARLLYEGGYPYSCGRLQVERHDEVLQRSRRCQ